VVEFNYSLGYTVQSIKVHQLFLALVWLLFVYLLGLQVRKINNDTQSDKSDLINFLYDTLCYFDDQYRTPQAK
jgi:hypothetical protein